MKSNNYNYDRFTNLDFIGFRELASDNSLSKYEKIGFPDSYRKGKEKAIFKDIKHKLFNLNKNNQVVLDVGPGCSDLPLMLLDLCERQKHTLIWIDSQEMLNHLPDRDFVIKIPAYYPHDLTKFFDEYKHKIDAIIIYSVFHYVFLEGNIFNFLDKSISLLADGGQMLIGDIPNVSKRNRFFSSENGISFHQSFTQTNEIPSIVFNTLQEDKIDDAVIMSILMRCRNFGCDAYWMPQSSNLPMANRREDILVTKP